MSKYTNVNPGQYKTRGRERPNTLAEVRQTTAQRKRAKASVDAQHPAARSQRRRKAR